MRDLDIRQQLRQELSRQFPGDIIRGELGLCLGQTRVDVAVVNGHLHGYEIKSERDTLARLPSQIDLYNRVLDYSTIVCGARHMDQIVDRVPAAWGIIKATGRPGEVELKAIRKPIINASPDPLSVAQLLWRDEAAEVLIGRGERVRSRDTRWDLWDRLAELPLHALQDQVRFKLKARQSWPGG